MVCSPSEQDRAGAGSACGGLKHQPGPETHVRRREDAHWPCSHKTREVNEKYEHGDVIFCTAEKGRLTWQAVLDRVAVHQLALADEDVLHMHAGFRI